MGEPREFHALGRLIRDAQQANGWSYADISKNAGRAGRNLSRSRVESLRNDRLASIGIKAIEALAAGLDVPADRVAHAALESMGYPAAEPTSQLSSTDALLRDPGLSTSTRKVLLAALDAAYTDTTSAGVGSRAPAVRSRRSSGRTPGHEIADIAADSD